MVARAITAATWLTLGCAAVVIADDVRKWRDGEGNLHYSVTGSPADSRDHEEGPILQGRGASPEEAFSVESSLQRQRTNTWVWAVAPNSNLPLPRD